jgi:hypothetical protein
MIIGVDFDNTIADYTGVFYNVALDLGWIPVSVGQSKNEVKAYFIERGTEPKWTELQGIVYGKEIHRAKPYQHCLAALQMLKSKGHSLFLVSHKTRYPIIGDKIDLHLAAQSWLHQNNFIGEDSSIFTPDTLFFNETKDLKLAKISELNCDIFIDDLESILTHEKFPSECKAILFKQEPVINIMYQLKSWSEIDTHI